MMQEREMSIEIVTEGTHHDKKQTDKQRSLPKWQWWRLFNDQPSFIYFPGTKFSLFFFLNISILLIVPEILITYSNALLPSPYILLEEPQKKEKKKTTTSLRVPVMVVPTCQSLAEAEACDNSDARGDNS